jgi:hypothetical protein
LRVQQPGNIMEFLIITFVLIAAMATVDLPNGGESKSELAPVKVKKSRRSGST